MNPTARSASPISTRSLLILALAALAPAAAGCGQEGKTVQNALPIQGLSFDASSFTRTKTDTTTTFALSMKFKVQTTYLNGCEARGGLELRSEVSGDTTLYVVTPVARYTADESCNIGISGDTLQTITINGLSLTRKVAGVGGITDTTVAYADSLVLARFEFRGFGAPPIRAVVDLGSGSKDDDSTRYFVRVEDASSGAALSGANVRVERYGTPDVLGEGVSDAAGGFACTVPCAGAAGTAADPYVVKVSYSGRITVLRVVVSPALCKRRESIVVRV